MAFTHDLADYTRDYDIIETYKRQMTIGLSRMKGVSLEDARAHIDGEVSKVDLDKFVAHFTYRGKNGDREMKSAPILGYIDTIVKRGWTMSPSMTTYLKPSVKPSFATTVIAGDQARRSVVKKDAQTAKQAGDTTGATIGKGMQNAIKFLVNSWSGAALSPSTPYFNPSMHPTLTSMCRISTALATATAERLIAGKRYYHTPDRVVENILLAMEQTDRTAVQRALEVYKLVTPTSKDVMDVIKSSTMYYWEDEASMRFIEDLVSKMDGTERAGFVYYGDLYHLFKLNDGPIREFLTETSQSANSPATDKSSLSSLDGDMKALLSNLIGMEIKGKKLSEAVEESPEIANLAERVADNLVMCFDMKYRRLVETFFRVPYFPIDTARQFNAIRKAVALGDTDSTVFTTGPMCELYYGEKGYGEDQEPVNDVVTYLINGTIAHALAHFTGQMDISPELRHLLTMKNEFKFPSVQLTPAGKTYHAYTKAEEGNVYAQPEWELKGSRLHAGRSNREVTKRVHDWMKKGKLDLNAGGKIDRGDLVDIILDVEHDLRDSLKRKDNVYFNVIKIKPKEEYGNPMGVEWGKHELYNMMFADTHGKAPAPIYTAYKVNLSFPSGIKAWYDSLPEKYQRRYMAWMDKAEIDFKKPPTYITIPTDNFIVHGLPDILRDVVDLRKVALASLDSAYLNLASAGINLDYDKNGRGLLLSDIIDD